MAVRNKKHARKETISLEKPQLVAEKYQKPNSAYVASCGPVELFLNRVGGAV